MPEILQVSFRAVLEGLALSEYERESALPELGKINPNWKLYEMLENGGAMQTFAAFENGKMVGFATVMIYEVPHYSKKVATTESIFVALEWRPVGVGTVLMKHIEDFARKAGCHVFFYSAPVHSQIDKLLSFRKKGRHSNNVYLVTL